MGSKEAGKHGNQRNKEKTIEIANIGNKETSKDTWEVRRQASMGIKYS